MRRRTVQCPQFNCFGGEGALEAAMLPLDLRATMIRIQPRGQIDKQDHSVATGTWGGGNFRVFCKMLSYFGITPVAPRKGWGGRQVRSNCHINVILRSSEGTFFVCASKS